MVSDVMIVLGGCSAVLPIKKSLSGNDVFGGSIQRRCARNGQSVRDRFFVTRKRYVHTLLGPCGFLDDFLRLPIAKLLWW